MARFLERKFSCPVATVAALGLAACMLLVPAALRAQPPAPLIMTGGFLVSAPEQTDTGPSQVAAFVDPDADPQAPDASLYSATIDWGDATSSAGTILFDFDLVQFLVLGSHTYADEGSFVITVTVAKTGVTPDASTTSDALITEADDLSGVPVSFVTTVGTAINGAVAHFSNVNTLNSPSDFVSTIDWGDGSPVAAGTISQPTPGSYDVSGSHTYTTAGLFTITVTLSDDAPGTATATVQSSAQVDALPAPVAAVPALSGWGLGALVGGLVVAALMLLRPR